MNLKQLLVLLVALDAAVGKWSPGKIAAVGLGGAALLGGGALLAGSLLGKSKKNKEEEALRAKLTTSIADKRVERSQRRTEMVGAKSRLDQDLSELQTTMDLLTSAVKDKIEDVSTLLDNGAAAAAGGGRLI